MTSRRMAGGRARCTVASALAVKPHPDPRTINPLRLLAAQVFPKANVFHACLYRSTLLFPPRPSEAFTLYETGIDLLLQGAKQEPAEQRRQTLIREASVHMSRAENIKLALAPPQPPSPPRPAAATAATRGKGKGKAALSRPTPTAADVRGNLRVRQPGGSKGCI